MKWLFEPGWTEPPRYQRPVEHRTSLSGGDPWLIGIMSRGSQSSAGTYVTPDSALRLTAVFRAVEIISTTIGMLPLYLYRLAEKGKTMAVDHPLFNLVGFKPNAWQTSMEWREMMTAHYLLRGNAYSEIDWNNDGSISQLVPLNPDRIKPFRDKSTGKIWYEFRAVSGQARNIAADDMFHLRGISADGLVGLSRIALHREAVGLGMAAEEFEARFFSNDATPPLAIKMGADQVLTDEAKRRLKEDFQQAHSGLPNAHKVAILEEGMDITTIGVSNKDAEFLALRKFQVLEIARMFGLPAHMLVDLDRATFSNIEQQNQEFVDFGLMPHIRRWEQRLKFDLLGQKAQALYVWGFLVRSLLRGDSAARAAYYTTMFNSASLSPNQILELEDMNPRADPAGDDYYVSANVTNVTNPPPAPVLPPDPKPPNKQQSQRLRELTLESHARIVRKEVTALRKLAKKHPPNGSARHLLDAIEEFYTDFEADEEYIKESKRGLRVALVTTDPAALEELLEGWVRARAEQITEKEMREYG